MTLCTDWITGEDVAACCDVSDASDPTIFDLAAEQAQELLYEVSGRLFPGVCEQTVRPCWTGCACGWQVLSRGYVVWNPNWYGGWGGGLYGGWMCDNDSCGCMPLSKVPLAGYVQDIASMVGSRPSSCMRALLMFRSLLIVSIMCTGLRMVRA